MQLPDSVTHIIETLEKHGYEAYAVGGCVRDSLLGKEPKDWDITTSAKPEEVKELFPRTIDTGIEHGTVTVMINHEGFEVTTYRIDGKYEDGRHPTEVIFTPSLKEDLKRRDFTINAMAYNHSNGIVDLFDGRRDLEQKVIRCVGDAKERFTEDALRMMRAVRFAAQLGFTIEGKTKDAIRELAPTLQKISAERIQVELVKLVTSDHPREVFTLYETGLTAVFFPEFDRMMKTPQNNLHHKYNVGEHVVKAMEHVPAEKVLRLTMLLHDVAKPDCLSTDEKGIYHFYNHPKKGSEMARKILRRLKFDNDTIAKVTSLVAWHDDNPPVNPRSIRRAIVRVGETSYPAIFAVKRADIMAKSEFERQKKFDYVDAYERMYQQIKEQKQCLSIKELAVDGKDLIEIGLASGPKLGECLKGLLEYVLDEPKRNTKEQLLMRAKNQYNL